jgi:tetratricopeptide (TPR) repeat protein
VERPELQWERIGSELDNEANNERLRLYFAQDRSITHVRLRPITPGRSGAVPMIAFPTAERGGLGAQLHPEFVKIAPNETEFQRFKELAEGTALVHGLHLAREPYIDSNDGTVIFGFPLFEAGQEVSSLYAVALGNPAKAQTCLVRLTADLTKWYNVDSPVAGRVQLPVDEARISFLIGRLEALSKPTAKVVGDVLRLLQETDLYGALSRVHGDLHLENVLVPSSGNVGYLIDFANATASGSPCIDIARLEADIVYRTLPVDVTPAEIGEFEGALWAGRWADVVRSPAGALVATIRRNQPIYQTRNAEIWLLTGRIINALRMLAGSWENIYPYKFEERRHGIVASVRVLADCLRRSLAGATISLVPDSSRRLSADATEGLHSVSTLFKGRNYVDAFELADAISVPATKLKASISLFGAVAAVSDHKPAAAAKMYEAVSGALRTPLERGLRNLYRAMVAGQDAGSSRKSIRLLMDARAQFDTEHDDALSAIAADQEARIRQRTGDIESAKVRFHDSLRLKSAVGDEIGRGATLGGLGLLYMMTADFDDARRFFLEDMALVQKLGDRRVEVKLYNWLGQISLVHDFDVIKATECFQRSLSLIDSITDPSYRASLDRAYAQIGLGFVYSATDSRNHASVCSAAAMRELSQLDRTMAQVPSVLCELLNGQIALLDENVVIAWLRIRSALAYLKELGLLGDECQYAIRACQFLARHGEVDLAANIAAQVRRDAESLNSAKLYQLLSGFMRLS